MAEPDPEPGPEPVALPVRLCGSEQRAVVAGEVARLRAAGRGWADIGREFGRSPSWALKVARLAGS